MGADQVRVMSNEPTLAGRIYAAVRKATEQDSDVRLPEFAAVPDKGRAWFSLANEVDKLLAPPVTADPWKMPLSVPVPERRAKNGEVILETLPTALLIRPMIAGDLCAGDPLERIGGEAQHHAIQAHIHGVDVNMLEWRIDAGDAYAADMAITAATGEDAADILARLFYANGGDIIDVDGRAVDEPPIAWLVAALEALSTDHGDSFLLRCRTPGIGEIKIGPVRAGHVRIHADATAKFGAWRGRISALATVLDRPVEQIEALRVEDMIRAWTLFDRLKKKSEARGLSIFDAARSTPSMAGVPATSTTSPSPS